MKELNDKLETLNQMEIARLYKKVFDSAEGKLVLQDLTNRFNPQVPAVFEDVQIDPYRLVMNEGKRSVMFHISSQIEAEDVQP
jgi:hypothetical protein